MVKSQWINSMQFVLMILNIVFTILGLFCVLWIAAKNKVPDIWIASLMNIEASVPAYSLFPYFKFADNPT